MGEHGVVMSQCVCDGWIWVHWDVVRWVCDG